MSLQDAAGLYGQRPEERVTLPWLQSRKHAGAAIVAVTAYDYPTARLADEAGVDVVLVGDSLGMVVLGYPDTLSVTMDEMLHHGRAVRRGLERALLVLDMPFGSYHVSVEDAVRNGLRMVKDAGAACVKLEGGRAFAEHVRALTRAEVPVMGHLGLTPQSVHRMGGFRVQGRSESAAAALIEDALALEDAGAVAVVLECVPRELALRITSLLSVPTIGIGAGPDCDGQILVMHDLLGLTATSPKFVRRFADARATMSGGLSEYCAAVRSRAFPQDTESYHAPRSAAPVDTLAAEVREC